MPSIQTTAYGTVEGVTTFARALVNDMLTSSRGEILTDTAPFTFPLLNMAADYFTKKLTSNGYKTFVFETVLSPITPCNFPNLGLGGADPGQQVNISDTGYFDGSEQHYPPALPSNLLVPERLWERETGTQEPWLPMDEATDGLPSVAQGQRLCIWEWRTEIIWMAGATQTNDVKVRYEASAIQFSSVNDSVQIRGSQSALANYLAAVFVNSRNPQAAASFSAAGDDFTDMIIRENVHALQRKTVTRQAYGSRGRGRAF
ncbi:MAG: hypothetical protein ACRD8A_12675 [Candidatus Acidiferrales bacterium]